MLLTGSDYIFYAFLNNTSSSTPGTYTEKRRIPYATEVPMSNSDSTTVAQAIASIYKAIPNNTDLDSLLNTGLYQSPLTVAGVGTLTNCPSNIPFVMIVSGNGNLTGCNQFLSNGQYFYARRATSSGFTAWYKVTATVVS